MPKRIPGRLLFPLLLFQLLGPPKTSAQAPAPPDQLDELVKQCVTPKTALACRAAVPACAQLFQIVRNAPPSSNLNFILDRFWSQVGWCKHELGDDAAAEAALTQALTHNQRAYGMVSVQVATSMHNLGGILYAQGQYARAMLILDAALKLRKKLLGPDHPDVADTMCSLANVYLAQGRDKPAAELWQQSLDLRIKLHGFDHPDVAASLFGLASVMFGLGQYERAAALFQQVLDISKKFLPPNHQQIAGALNNLAKALEAQNQYARAAELLQQALDMNIERLGPKHPDVATSLDSLSTVLFAAGRTDVAVEKLIHASQIRESQLRSMKSELRMQALLASVYIEETMIYSLLEHRPVGKSARELALRTALLRKGRALEAGATANRVIHRNLGTPAIKQLFLEWQTLRQNRDALMNVGVGNLSMGEFAKRLTQFSNRAEELETQLATDLPELEMLLQQPPDWDSVVGKVAGKLGSQSVLVEVVWFTPYRPPNQDTGSQKAETQYYALLLFGDGRSEAVDLGAGTTVNARVRALLSDLGSNAANPQRAARALYDQVLAPLLPKLGGISELYLSLDGMLNLVPFDALHDGKNYLLGRWRFHYLTSGRDLLRAPSQQPGNAPLLLANPDFGQVDKEPLKVPSLYARLHGLSPLPGAQKEAEWLKPLLGVEPLLMAAATEEAIRQARAPRILHIATHGLFLDDRDMPVSLVDPETLRSRELSDSPHPQPALPASRSKLAPLTPELYLEPIPGATGAMYRSAVALAGVLQGRRAGSTANDGLLTAEEARSLDLDGTQLVTLSACDTGQGGMSAGQGIYGLRRAFLLAGAETLVTSLWRVNDKATGELMALYYGKLLNKQKPGDRLGAMVEAMQELRARPDRSHPHYWAPFLVTGQDGPLRP